MKLQLRFSRGQFLYFAAAIRTVAEGIILGASAAAFLPETFQLKDPISLARYAFFLSIGLILLFAGATLSKRGAAK